MINLRIFLKYFIIATATLGFSCRPKYVPDAVFTSSNNFENMIGWVGKACNNSFAMNRESAYEGAYGCEVNKNQNFSYIFKAKYADITRYPAKKAILSFMCKRISDKADSCHVVCCFEKDGQIKAWKTNPINNEILSDEWVEVQREFDLAALGPEDEISMSVWNQGSSQRLYIDNLKIELY